MFRDITIKAVANGWIVAVGCQTFVFDNANHLTGELNTYLKDPDATEKRMLETAINIGHTSGNDPYKLIGEHMRHHQDEMPVGDLAERVGFPTTTSAQVQDYRQQAGAKKR